MVRKDALPAPVIDAPIMEVIASGVHDTKNVLFDAITRIGVARKAIRDGATADAPPLLDDASAALEQAVERLSNLLSAYRLSRNENPVSLLPVVVADLLDEARLRVPPMTQSGTPQVEISCDFPPAFTGLWLLDRELINDSLVNALQNARRHARSAVRLTAQVTPGWLNLRVEDDGDGFDAERLRNPEAGSGIGLSVSRRLARLHQAGGQQGRLELSNGGALGGAVFSLWLPG